eukprot:COSAG03_NODE_605_length_6748_cov_9.478869_3_plen_69_part_00
MKSIYSKLPNDIIMKIIKIHTEQEEERRNKFLFGRCMYELKYEYGVKEDWEMEDSYESDASYHSSDDY